MDRALEIAQKMKSAGRPFNEIAEFTGLSAETIEGL
jgi:DNA-binding Lrp family transcriptional regulator